jgi:putative addiction module component (TIGR02574 family)
MPHTVAELLEAALALPEAERAELAELLAATVNAPANCLQPRWAAECRRRAAEIDSGQVRPVPWNEVRRQVQVQLDAGGLSQPMASASDVPETPGDDRSPGLLAAEQRAELARRDAELDANPGIALTWEQIRASVEGR